MMTWDDQDFRAETPGQNSEQDFRAEMLGGKIWSCCFKHLEVFQTPGPLADFVSPQNAQKCSDCS